jgi:cystathionine beta-lyase family protein involved in aluminum resistance
MNDDIEVVKMIIQNERQIGIQKSKPYQERPKMTRTDRPLN